MSTLHEEQHSDTEEELAAVKNDDPVVTPEQQKVTQKVVESVTSTTATSVTASQPDPENQNEFQANQVKNKINSFSTFFIFVKLLSFFWNNFWLSEQKTLLF